MSIGPVDLEQVFSACNADAITLLRSVQAVHSADPVYAVALCVDNDVSTLYPAINTHVELQKLIQQTERRNAEHVSKLQAMRQLVGSATTFLPAVSNISKKDVENNCKWYPGDWALEVGTSNDFMATNTALGAVGRIPAETREAFLARKTVAVQQLTRALAAARDEVLPDADVTVFVCIMDAEPYARKIMLDAASRVNAAQNYAALARALS